MTDQAMIMLSRRCLACHYEKRDMDGFMRYLAPDATWIGPLENQYAHTAADVERIVRPSYGTPVALEDDEWEMRILLDHCIVTGRYALVLREDGRERIRLRQSATFVWSLAGGAPSVIHLHVSNSYDVPSRLGRPFECGEDSVAYLLQSVVSPIPQRRRLAFASDEGVRYVSEGSILYLKAEKKRCRVCCDDGAFLTRTGLTCVAASLSEEFLQVHRSYVVNARRVRDITRFEIRLDDGQVCPVSERRYGDVVASIQNLESGGARIGRTPAYVS